MKTYGTETWRLCSDCVYMAANGWDEAMTGRPLPDPVPLCRVPDDALIGGCVEDDCEGYFSWAPCDGCGGELGGSRCDVTVVRTASTV